MFDSLRPCGLKPVRSLCPWDSPGKNTGVGCHPLPQGIFLIQGSNSGLLSLLHCHLESLSSILIKSKKCFLWADVSRTIIWIGLEMLPQWLPFCVSFTWTLSQLATDAFFCVKSITVFICYLEISRNIVFFEIPFVTKWCFLFWRLDQ